MLSQNDCKNRFKDFSSRKSDIAPNVQTSWNYNVIFILYDDDDLFCITIKLLKVFLFVEINKVLLLSLSTFQ